jgi:group I intron endonuclease
MEVTRVYSGVYEIVNTENGQRYIGSAVSLCGRFAVHRHGLTIGKHHSRYLQRSWDKYGSESFQFRPLLICAPKDLLFYEQRAIDALRPEYNLAKVAGNCLGVRWSAEARARKSAEQKAKPSFAGRKHRLETIALMSALKMGNTATKGKKRSPEAVAATAAAHRGMKRSAETRRRLSEAAKRRWRKT